MLCDYCVCLCSASICSLTLHSSLFKAPPLPDDDDNPSNSTPHSRALLPVCLCLCHCLYPRAWWWADIVFCGIIASFFQNHPKRPISTPWHLLSISYPGAWWLLTLVSVYRLLCLWNQSAEALLAPEVPKWVSFQIVDSTIAGQTAHYVSPSGPSTPITPVTILFHQKDLVFFPYSSLLSVTFQTPTCSFWYIQSLLRCLFSLSLQHTCLFVNAEYFIHM